MIHPFGSPALAQSGPATGFVNKLGIEVDVRSGGRILQDDLLSGNVLLPDSASPVGGGLTAPQIQLRGGNVQVNINPETDYIQIFPGFRPFLHFTQSEVSAAASGRNIVVTYNNSAGLHVSPNPSGPGLITDRVKLSGFSVSNDGGQTWTSGFMPLSAGASQTFGDPYVVAFGVGRMDAVLGDSQAGARAPRHAGQHRLRPAHEVHAHQCAVELPVEASTGAAGILERHRARAGERRRAGDADEGAVDRSAGKGAADDLILARGAQ